MRATDLVEEYPTVLVGDPAINAAQIIGSQRKPGVVVLDDSGGPVTVLPASQVLNFLVPTYIQEDPSLARVYDERAADELASRLEGNTVGDMLPKQEHRLELPVVDSDATVLECSAVMARLRCPLVVVSDGRKVLGVVTASRLLDALFG